MTCIEVRDRLTEHSLGGLSKTDAREVERHLEWCPGCRKEASELFEGAASMALALPLAEPPSSLEGRIVERFRMAAGRAPVPSRVRLWVLVAATMTAALLAMGSFGWAVAERGKAKTADQKKAEALQRVKDLAGANASVVKLLHGRGQVFTATLEAPAGLGFGTAFIFSGPNAPDIVMIDVPIPPAGAGPFIVQMVDGSKAINVGRLKAVGDGLVLPRPWLTSENLSRVLTVTVIDGSTGAVALTGQVEPYAS